MPQASARAPPQALFRARQAARRVARMGDTWEQECAGRGDGADCPVGAVLTVDAGIAVYRCDDCRHHWELDATEPGRRPGEDDDGLTRPLGEPDEAGHRETAA